ncbi:uncharacterized protein ACA1_085500 [Acanthamoeba castellanii str. Neff]|uniref:FHA domain-containing protein n=1 Tax=Acanthamoeba castellanii (strain ATCC 30010 / Neff) TaxID=1257118 RepID=L8HMT0_ACACF|nr:uncharacterized protein ACA1_085500 [Acanthamoeba castellanii str. Neff]ELR25701.1 hypothetical protein ACA1_085500 [Acanthamoeba castellanii str. Neff]
MELVEPLLLTISNVKELVQSHAEISNEVSDLAIRPLGSSGNDDPHLKDVLRALQLSMVNAKTALEKVATATTISQRVMSWFRSSTDLSELKGHQEKLKTLCPILSLAITTSQQNKNKGGAGADQEFNAMRLVKNEETKRFWAHHFGPKTFKVTWDQFRAAFEHEFEAQRDSNIELLRQRLDRNNDGDVDIYELATFTGQLSVLDSYQQLVEQHGQRRQQQQQQQQTQRVKRPAPRGDEQERRASEKEPVNKKPRTEDLDKRLMGPPLASLAKAKFALAPDSHHVVMDEDDSEECMFAYKLLLFARDEIFQMKGCQGIRTLYRQWHPDKPFVLGRMMMEHLPTDLLVRISRSHFEIHCSAARTLNDSNEVRHVCESVLEALNLLGTFGSGNGTFINGKRLTKSKKMLLHSGDQIGIVTDKERLLVEMGYTFQPIN